LGESLLWAVFENCRSKAMFFGYLFPRQKLCIEFGKKWLGYILGDFLNIRIWSPW
jgi:hypothetical protein